MAFSGDILIGVGLFPASWAFYVYSVKSLTFLGRLLSLMSIYRTAGGNIAILAGHMAIMRRLRQESVRQVDEHCCPK